MNGVSWSNGPRSGGVEVWHQGIIVTVGPVASEMLTDRSLILSLYHSLGDWLVTHPKEPPS